MKIIFRNILIVLDFESQIWALLTALWWFLLQNVQFCIPPIENWQPVLPYGTVTIHISCPFHLRPHEIMPKCSNIYSRSVSIVGHQEKRIWKDDYYMPYFGCYVTHILKVWKNLALKFFVMYLWADHNLTIQCVHSTFSFGPSPSFLASPWPSPTESE